MDSTFLWSVEYHQDILTWLKKRELEAMEFKKQSPQIHQRRHLVDWTSVVGERLKLTRCTVHLAVKLLDYFMDGHDIQDPQLYLVCLGSILLAAKVQEKDSNVPKCSQLNAFVKHQFPLSDFVSLEIVILKYFNWNLCIPTASYFVEMWIPHSISPTDSHNNGPIVSFREAKAYFLEYVKYFLDLVMQETVFVDKLPSMLAAALLAASRIAFGLSPGWPITLEDVSGYRLKMLEKYTTILLSTFKRDAKEMEDEGYESKTSSPVKDNKSLDWSRSFAGEGSPDSKMTCSNSLEDDVPAKACQMLEKLYAEEP